MTDQALTPDYDDAAARRNVVVLVLAQAVLGAQMPMIFVTGGLAGNMLSTNPCLATLPISMIVFGSMTTAPWLSPYMQRNGRKAGFIIGALAGAAGAAMAAFGLYIGSFITLLAGSYLTGIYMSAQGFYRFAATDMASDDFKPKAISYVMAGGLLSAILGPQLNKGVMDAWMVPFFGTYAAVVVLNLVGLFLFFALNLPDQVTDQIKKGSAAARSKAALLKDPRIAVAVICAMVSYALMNLVMTSTPLAVVGCGFTNDNANDIVSAHVLAMFAPSFFTGHLIARFGVEKIIGAGLIILGFAGVVALTGVELVNFFGALILLGLGWNFGFIGATTLLASSHSVAERGRVQGMNDALVFGCVTVAS
ncbi:MAG: MFS transporter, partial [Litoreibacter sp.]|nr:MFS transporter [Litoreibacter sp.]